MWVYDKPVDSGSMCFNNNEISFELWMESILILIIFMVILCYFSSSEIKA